MAKAIATVSGVALVPGVSKNGRLYTREAIAKAVSRAQSRIAAGESLDIVRRDRDPAMAGDEPMSQLTHHAAEDDSTRIVGRVTSVSLTENGSARFDAAIADTPHGRTVASLLDTADGNPPFLKGVSIRGAWLGKVRRVPGPAGDPVETADDLELDGLDYTRKPGVTGAQVDAFAWAKGGATETDERVLITESVQEARVTISEEIAPLVPAVPDGVGETLRTFLGVAPAIEEAGTPPMSKRDSGLSGSGKVWADPGYQADHKQRYDITTKDVAKTAWQFINQKSKAAKYTPAQLKRVKARIIKALKSFGVTVSATEAAGWMFEEPFQVSESVLEWMGDPDTASRSGSWCINACNGPVSLSLSSYCMDPSDLAVILRSAADAAAKALAQLDPDMDGDVDVPGVGDGSDTDGDAPDESAETDPGQVTETSPPDPAPEPAAEPQPDKEVPAMVDTATPAVEASPAAATDPKAIAEAVEAALAKRDADRKAAKKAEAKAAKKAAKTAETAAPDANVTETAAPDIEKIVAERIAAQLAEQGLTETTDQKIARLVEEGVTAAKQQLVASGQVVPGRKGLSPGGEVNEHTARVGGTEGEMPPAPPGKSWDEMHKWTSEDLDVYAGPAITRHVLKDRAGLLA